MKTKMEIIVRFATDFCEIFHSMMKTTLAVCKKLCSQTILTYKLKKNLLFESAHPQHTKEGTPYSQFLRIRRVCTRDKDYKLHCQNLIDYFVARHYPRSLLEAALTKANLKSRHKLLYPPPKTKSDNNTLQLTLTFHPTDRQSQKILNDNLRLLGDPVTQDQSMRARKASATGGAKTSVDT